MDRLKKLIPQSLEGDLRRGGWQLTGYVEGDTDAVAEGQNWVVRAKSGASFVDAEWREIFSGHILSEPESIEFSRYQSRIEVSAGTMNELLEGVNLQAIGFTNQATPANDHQINGLNFARMVEHILRRHCNAVYDDPTMPDGVVNSLTVDTTDSTTQGRFNVDKSDNLWRSLQDLGGGEEASEFYFPWFSRRNEFYYQAAPPFWTTPPVTKGIITKDHLRGAVKVVVNSARPRDKIGQVSLTAYANFDTFYNATYPANPGRGKILPPRKGIYANSQARADVLAQRLYDWLTRPYSLEIEVDPGLILLGDDGRGLDLGDKVTLTYNGPAEDTISGAGVHLNFAAQSFFIYGAKVDFDPAGHMAAGILLLEYDPT
jgi:hypothetical protein